MCGESTFLCFSLVAFSLAPTSWSQKLPMGYLSAAGQETINLQSRFGDLSEVSKRR